MLQDQSMVTTLSTCDYARLQVLMSTLTGSRQAIANLARRKLASAIVVLPSELPCSTVSVGKRVRFRLDAGATSEQELTWQPAEGEAVSSLEPIGLALLGLQPSQTVSYRDDSGNTRRITVEGVTTAKDAPETAMSSTVIVSFQPRMWREFERRLSKWLQSRASTALKALNDNMLADIRMKRQDLDAIAAQVVASNRKADIS